MSRRRSLNTIIYQLDIGYLGERQFRVCDRRPGALTDIALVTVNVRAGKKASPERPTSRHTCFSCLVQSHIDVARSAFTFLEQQSAGQGSTFIHDLRRLS